MHSRTRIAIVGWAVVICCTVGAIRAAQNAHVSRRIPALIVLHKADDTAMIVRLDTGERLATFPTGHAPHEVAVSPDHRWAVVANYGDRDAPGHTLTVIDLHRLRVARTIDLAPYTRPHGIMFLPNGHVIVTCEGRRSVVVVDLSRGQIVQTVRTDADVSHMVAVPDRGDRAFVANIGSGSVTVIDLGNGTVLRHIPAGRGTEGIDVTRNGRWVFVTNRAEHTVARIDPEEGRVVQKAATCRMPIRVRLTPDERYLVVSCARADAIAIHRADDLAIETVLRVGAVPIGIVLAPDGRTAYVALTEADRIAVVDLSSRRVTRTIPTGDTPDGMAWVVVSEPQFMQNGGELLRHIE